MIKADFEAKETTLRLRYYYGLDDIRAGENIICIDSDTLVMQVERLELYLDESIPEDEFEMNDTLYACVNVIDKNYYAQQFIDYEVNDQLFVDYGSNYARLLQ